MTNDDKRDTEEQEPEMQPEPKQQGVASASGKEQGVVLPPEAQGRIGKELRKVYGDMLSEPMPDKFAELLQRLSKSETQR